MKENTVNSHDREYLLLHQALRLRVSPFGASLRGMWQENGQARPIEIITQYSGAENNVGSQGDVLIPFPSRIPDGRYTFDGQSHQLAPNDGTGRHAMHGFLRAALWETAELSENAVTFAIRLKESDFPGYPFALRAEVTYRLEDAGLYCFFRAENSGTGAAPFGAGFHPYFTVGQETIDDDVLHLPLEQILQNGKLAEVAGTRWDHREPKPLGAAHYDAVYSKPIRDADGRARLRYSSSDGMRGVTVWIDETFDYLVVYSGDTLPPLHQRRALALEPWTCAPNAFNYPERGLKVLSPGEVFSGSWGVTLR